MIAIFVMSFANFISLQSSPIRGVHVAREFELVLLDEDMLYNTNDGSIKHWAPGWYHPRAHSVRPYELCSSSTVVNHDTCFHHQTQVILLQMSSRAIDDSEASF